MDHLAWAIILLLLGLGLAILEIFVPSGGVIGFLSGLSLLISIYFAYQHGTGTFVSFLGICVLCLPIGLSLAVHYWPRTPIGRRVLLGTPREEDLLPDSLERRELKALVGKIGRAKSLMLPSGAVVIEGRTVDALSEGIPIEAGQIVKVVEVRGTRVVVQPTDEYEAPPSHPDDPLSRPFDQLGLDPFDDPLA
jgi:membrane-bound ClpP family serine protease